jgi:hypothetical protein
MNILSAEEIKKRCLNNRINRPELIEHSLAARPRRSFFELNRRIFLVAADHPARGILDINKSKFMLADRINMLRHLAILLNLDFIDGIMATPDVIEDLAILGCLANKLAIATLNRGGLSGSAFEFEDLVTALDINSRFASYYDGFKILLRIKLSDRGTLVSLSQTAELITASAEMQRPVFLELIPVLDTPDDPDAFVDHVIRDIHIASALGSSSAYTWLKLPLGSKTDRIEEIVNATTLPIVLLGGDPPGGLKSLISPFKEAFKHESIRGLALGRSVLNPEFDITNALNDLADLLTASEPHVGN